MRRRLGTALDVAVALSVALLGALDIWAPHVTQPANIVGPRPALALSYAIAAAALLWRRRAPLLSLLVVCAALGVEFLVFGSPEGIGNEVALLFGLYAVAAYEERRRAAIGAAAVALVAAVHELRDPMIRTFHDELAATPYWLILVIPWLLGAYVRTRRLYVAELVGRAERAEEEREERARSAVADERSRIARELHDVIAHSVSVMVVQAEAAAEILDARPDRVREPLAQIQHTGREALTELRRLLGILRRDDSRAELAPQPGISNLESLLEQVRDSGLPVELAVEGRSEGALPPGVDLAAYRIVQEALTNSLKHAGPAHARVLVRYAADALELEVTDDGRGDGNGAGGGHGLAGMRERIGLYGGELKAGIRSEGGYLVHARLPLEVPH